jgi:hypothetical protein
VLAVLEGAATDPRLRDLGERLAAQRLTTATWIVRTLATKHRLRADLPGEVGAETVWTLMDPAVFDRLVRYRHWSVPDYQDWFARSAGHLLLPDHPIPEGAPR